jgi:ABC-type microcin C transport system duplicated ATPase subunit YejF
MRFFLALAALGAAPLAAAQDANTIVQQEIQRALIQRDQQSAEFSNRRLESLHARQLQELVQPALPQDLAPYQRQRMADERTFVLPPPVVVVKPPEKPLPLPGGPRHGVDPIPAQGTPH